MNQRINRRLAFQSTLAGAIVATTARPASLAANDSPNEKLDLVCIGVGGRGEANVSGVRRQNLVAFVDVDEQRAAKVFRRHSKTERFTDYRKMFDKLGSKIDGVVISTPDHSHFHPALTAMQLGLHVYLEKPLAHNVWETRTLTDFARNHKIATQLGAQRHAIPNLHRVIELIQAGAIGNVCEVHCWVGGDRGMPALPADSPPVPTSLDYDLWVGPAEFRPYHPSFCPYGWRFWWDFGTGETGNWGCHILDIPFWALGLRYPTRVEASGPEVDSQRTPKAMQTKFQFAETNQAGPITLHWSHGQPDVLQQHSLSEKGNNTLFIGSEGMLLCGFDQLKLLPEDKFADYQRPTQTIPDSPGFYDEWIAACKGGEPATCNFDYSGPLAETVLLGNVAYRAGAFDWNAQTLTTGGNADAQALIRESYRSGWELNSI
jgi:predicted dehydrogenase